MAAATRWRQSEANRRYRASERGKNRRRQQSARYRQRIGERKTAETSPLECGEGYGYAGPEKKIRCHRPGCYQRFTPQPRTPLRKFCNSECRQVSPIVVCIHDDAYVVIDGFKRLRAARTLPGISCLHARRMDVDQQGAKAAVYNLNAIARRPLELEESWIVHALVRQDGMSQVEVAELLGRHKSWVNRRLAMIERLCPAAQQELRLGLLSPALARQ